MKKIYNYLKRHPKFIIAWIIVTITIAIMLSLEIDKKLIAIISILIAWLTNAFIGIGTFVSLIPIVGPIIVNIFSIPFFWLMNGIGYFSSAYAIKKGQQKELLKHRLLTFVLLIGIIIGYILGHLIPTI